MDDAITQDDAITKSVNSICALLDRKRPEQAQQILANGPLVGKHLAFAMYKCMIAERWDALDVFFNHLDTTSHDPEEVFPVVLKCAAQCFASVDTFTALLQRTPQTPSALLGAVIKLIEYEDIGEDDDALKKFTALCHHASEDAMPMVWGKCVRMNALRFAATAYPRISLASNAQLHDSLLQCFRSTMSKKGSSIVTEELLLPDMFEMVIAQLSPEHENQVLEHLRFLSTHTSKDNSQVNIGPQPLSHRRSFAGPFIQERLLRKQLERAVEQPLKTATVPVRKM